MCFVIVAFLGSVIYIYFFFFLIQTWCHLLAKCCDCVSSWTSSIHFNDKAPSCLSCLCMFLVASTLGILISMCILIVIIPG